MFNYSYRCNNPGCKRKARFKLGWIYNSVLKMKHVGHWCSINCAKEYFSKNIGDCGFRVDSEKDVFVFPKNSNEKKLK